MIIIHANHISILKALQCIVPMKSLEFYQVNVQVNLRSGEKKNLAAVVS